MKSEHHQIDDQQHTEAEKCGVGLEVAGLHAADQQADSLCTAREAAD